MRVHSGGTRIGVLIENKIGAPEQDQQDERYHIRGNRSREAGKFDAYLTVMCAPRRYLEGLPSDSHYDHQVEYELIAGWFASLAGRRAAWRHRVMLEAIEQGWRGYVLKVSAVHTEFHQEYWEHLRRKHPRLQMVKPGPRGSKSNWIILKTHKFPKGVKLRHKVDQSVVELGFPRRTVEEILSLRNEWPDTISVIQKDGTASLSIGVRQIEVKAGVAAQIDAIEEALLAAYILSEYANLFSE
ncbi:hypothetical protein [Ensifer sp. B1-9]|uniref:hypothetical protein n=1 Tax=Ensifer sp. B1-9 TaxID=3141455 RepID=UPI003D1ACD14